MGMFSRTYLTVFFVSAVMKVSVILSAPFQQIDMVCVSVWVFLLLLSNCLMDAQGLLNRSSPKISECDKNKGGS